MNSQPDAPDHTVRPASQPFFEQEAIACAFDLLRLNSDDLRREPLSDRKAKLRKLLRRSSNGIQ